MALIKSPYKIRYNMKQSKISELGISPLKPLE